ANALVMLSRPPVMSVDMGKNAATSPPNPRAMFLTAPKKFLRFSPENLARSFMNVLKPCDFAPACSSRTNSLRAAPASLTNGVSCGKMVRRSLTPFVNTGSVELWSDLDQSLYSVLRPFICVISAFWWGDRPATASLYFFCAAVAAAPPWAVAATAASCSFMASVTSSTAGLAASANAPTPAPAATAPAVMPIKAEVAAAAAGARLSAAVTIPRPLMARFTSASTWITRSATVAIYPPIPRVAPGIRTDLYGRTYLYLPVSTPPFSLLLRFLQLFLLQLRHVLEVRGPLCKLASRQWLWGTGEKLGVRLAELLSESELPEEVVIPPETGPSPLPQPSDLHRTAWRSSE